MINPQPKRVPYRNKKITNAAKGEECTLQLAWRCSSIETTVFAHFNDSWAGKGVGQKADDCAGIFCCGACHEMYDQGKYGPYFSEQLLRAYYRTIRRLIDKGVLS